MKEYKLVSTRVSTDGFQAFEDALNERAREGFDLREVVFSPQTPDGNQMTLPMLVAVVSRDIDQD